MQVTAIWAVLGALALLYFGAILFAMLAPAPVGEAAFYFDGSFLSRAAAYQRAGLGLSLLQQLLSLIILAGVAFAALRYFQAAPRPSLPAAAGYIAAFLLFQLLVGLPLAFYRGHTIEHRFGLSARTAAGWFADYGKSALISLLITTAALLGLYVLIIWRQEHWWLPAGAVVALFMILSGYLYPVLIDPLFYRFSELEEGELHGEIMELSKKAGIEVERIPVADASRRTRKANAYFSGLGATKRIVLYDTLLENFTAEEVLAVVAHEMGHWRRGHLWRGLLLGAAGAFVALYALYQVLLKMGVAADFRALPLALLFFALLSTVVGPAQCTLSRSFEVEADRTALCLTGDPAPFVSLYRKLARSNLSVVQPHPLLKVLLYTHPPLMERIEAARSHGEGG